MATAQHPLNVNELLGDSPTSIRPGSKVLFEITRDHPIVAGTSAESAA
jgi:hypothetical protein